MFEKLTSREMRSINPTQDMLIEAFDYLISLGWKPVADARPNKPDYTYGWWIKADHPTKCRPVGDSKNLHLAAWDAIMLYIAPGN